MTRVALSAIVPVMIGALPGRTHPQAHGDCVTSIVWTTSIPPGEFAEFGFIGCNPKSGEVIVWKVHQRYAAGTASHWIDEPGTRSPAPTTTLFSAAQATQQP